MASRAAWDEQLGGLSVIVSRRDRQTVGRIPSDWSERLMVGVAGSEMSADVFPQELSSTLRGAGLSFERQLVPACVDPTVELAADLS